MIKQAQRDRYLFLNKKQDKVSYLPQGKTRKLSNPEEAVQIQAYLSLIYKYGYPTDRIRVCEKVKIGSSSREADIVVYEDSSCKIPFLIVECKKAGVSKAAFRDAVDQGFSYAAATHAKYVWVISGKKQEAYQVLADKIKERKRNRIRQIPNFRQSQRSRNLIQRKWQWMKNHPILGDTILYAFVLVISTLIFSKVAIEYQAWIYSHTEILWEKYGMNYLWIYNSIIFLASVFTLFFGSLFMRSYRLFGIDKSKRKTMFTLIGLILFIPAWYVGTSHGDASWWTLEHLDSRKYPILLFLLPYVKSIPLQIFAVHALIWLGSRSQGN